MSITRRAKIVCRRLGLTGSLAASALIAASAGGCDLGGRDRGVASDAGNDGGADASADGGEDAGPGADGGADGGGFQYADAGDTWIDEPVEIDGPCDNDCAYTYNSTPRELNDPYSTEQYGRASFDIGPGATDDVIVAREAHRFLSFLIDGLSSGYRQRAVQNLVLDAATHDLLSGDAIVYNAYAKSLYSNNRGIEMTKRYEFSYDEALGELAFSVESNGRTWERVLEAPEPPIVMLNYREYPIDTFGIHSPLTAMLLAERYESLGGSGVARIPIFSPELERMDTVEVEAGDGADTLIVRFPVDSAKPPFASSILDDVVYDTNDVTVTLEHGIPVFLGSRSNLGWAPVYAPSVELNPTVSSVEPTSITPPTVPEDGTEITAISGLTALTGIVDAPSSGGPHAAVVMVPGWDRMTARGEIGAVDLYAQLAELVVENGGVAARFDARGASDNGVAFSEATVEDLIGDAEAAVTAVKARTDVDDDRVFLLTTGAGAHIAAGVATEGDVSLAGIILVAPMGGAYADDASALATHYFTSASAKDEFVTTAATAATALFASLADGTYAGTAYRGHTVAAWQSLFSRNLVADPPELPPTLILYGTEDHLVPQSLVDALSTALAGANSSGEDAGSGSDVTTAILTGLSHALTVGTAVGLWPEHGGAESIDTTAASAITNWLVGIAGGL